MSSEIDLRQVMPAWLELASKTVVSLGLDPSEAFGRAERLLNELRSGQASTGGWAPDADQVEVLHALVALVSREADDAGAALSDIELASEFISRLPWPAENFAGSAELVSDCALHGWRAARAIGQWASVKTWESRLTTIGAPHEADFERLLSHPAEARASLMPANPVGVIGFLRSLHHSLESTPSRVYDVVQNLYSDINGFADDHKHRFIDEPYVLGQLAQIAGVACRILGRWGAARQWFEAADKHMQEDPGSQPDLWRLRYQCLALAAEESRFQDALQGLPECVESFLVLQMFEDALKCRVLEAAVRWELAEFERARDIYVDVLREAEALGSEILLAHSSINLVRCNAELGDPEKAIECAHEAMMILERRDARVPIAKLHWAVAELMRRQGRPDQAEAAFRLAQAAAQELGIRWDVVALHIVLADLLLETGKIDEAAWEIRAALPIIEEEKMLPEGIAALSLLRESLRRQQIDHGALRDLHRHLEDKRR